MKKIFTILFLIGISISTFAQTTVCFNTPDGTDVNGWSYKDYVIPAGSRIDSVNFFATRISYTPDLFDFIFEYCPGTTTYNGISVFPWNYQTDNTSEYNHWINLTSFNYSATGMVRVSLPTNAGAVWNQVCFAISSSCNPDIATGLIAQYDFTGNANDQSANANNGIISGASLVADRFGNVNSAYYYDGINNYIEIPNISAYNNQLYTISYWVKFSTASTSGSGGFDVNPALISKLAPSASVTYDNWVFYEGNGTPGFAYGTAGYGGSAALFNDNNWHNIVCTVNNDSVRFYYDGVQTDKVAKGPNLTFNTEPIRIGRSMATYWKAFNGIIDDFRIYNIPLTACDIDSLYNMTNPISVGISKLTKNEIIKVYPNPTNNVLNIANGQGNYIITDVFSRMVKEVSITSDNYQLNITGFKSGVYFLVSEENSVKFIKQ